MATSSSKIQLLEGVSIDADFVDRAAGYPRWINSLGTSRRLPFHSAVWPCIDMLGLEFARQRILSASCNLRAASALVASSAGHPAAIAAESKVDSV
jgi:hypothetical protein